MDLPVKFNQPIPDYQLKSPGYPQLFSTVLGTITVTSGFMEEQGHGYKSQPRKAIFKSGIKTLKPGNYNIGIDYTKGYGTFIKAWYSGVVVKAGLEGGYGYRVHIKTNIKFPFNDRYYEVYYAFAHCSQILVSVGDIIHQYQNVAMEAGHGRYSSRDYPSHVDLDFYIKDYNEQISIHPDVIADFMQENGNLSLIGILSRNRIGNGVLWLQSVLEISPKDGIFGEQTEASVKAFQRQANLVSDGIVGEITGKALNLTGFACLAKQDTVIKREPKQSSELVETQKASIKKGEIILANWIEDTENHWKIELRNHLNGIFNWYLWKAHFNIVEGWGKPAQSDLKDATESIWDKALIDCETKGHHNGGIQQSRKLAENDWKTFDKKHLPLFKEIGEDFDIPVGLMLGIASRESSIGHFLGQWGSNPGWGDNNHAFGVFQVDARSHAIVGKNDPFSEAHIRQAMEIFNRNRAYLQERFKDWSSSNILKGACVAYNAGLHTVRTIHNMNIGTTNNDYGDDVIARSQWFNEALK